MRSILSPKPRIESPPENILTRDDYWDDDWDDEEVFEDDDIDEF